MTGRRVAFAGLAITVIRLMSLVIDKSGWFGAEVPPPIGLRLPGAALTVGGIFLISRF